MFAPPRPALLACLTLFITDSSLSGMAHASDYKPVVCEVAKPYEGRPVFAGTVDLPLSQFVLGDEAGFDAATVSRLKEAMRVARTKGTTSLVTAAVADGRGRWSTTENGEGAARTNRFYWASVGKAFTAIVILQLVEEGKLSLSDPISKWDASVPNARVITLDHLLRHTSGLFSYNEDLVHHKRPRYLTPDAAIAIAARHGAMFCPGQNWRYSNTGYVLLGKVIERVDGRPYHEAVNERVIRKLGTRGLRCLGPNEIPADVAPFEPTGADKREGVMMPNWGYAAGCVVGSAGEMVTFWHAALTGKLLGPVNTRSLFESLSPMFDAGTYYGRGAMLMEVPEVAGPPRVWLSHAGGVSGMQAVVAYSESEKAFVAVSVSGTTSATALANLLLKKLGTVDPSR